MTDKTTPMDRLDAVDGTDYHVLYKLAVQFTKELSAANAKLAALQEKYDQLAINMLHVIEGENATHAKLAAAEKKLAEIYAREPDSVTAREAFEREYPSHAAILTMYENGSQAVDTLDLLVPQRAFSNYEKGFIAAMRCYVASKLGDEVDVPEELL